MIQTEAATYHVFISLLEGIALSDDANSPRTLWIGCPCHTKDFLIGKVIPCVHDGATTD